MAGLLDPALTVNGTGLYPMGGSLLSGVPVIRPERGDLEALFGTGDRLDLAQDAIDNIAGGIFRGVQYNPNAGRGEAMLQPIAPTGLFTTDPSQGVQVRENQRPNRGLTFRDALGLMYGPGRDMPPALFEALGSKNSKGRFGDLFGMKFDVDASFDPSNKDWQKLSGMLDDPYYYDNTP